MRLEQYLVNEGNTKNTTFYHEVGCAIYSIKPDAKITNGLDILGYFLSGDIRAKNPSLGDLNPDQLLLGGYGIFFKDEPIPSDMNKILDDAHKVSVGLVKRIGKPKQVWWTGPTNDLTKFGAADIVFVSGGKEVGISLKYGKGQLKNMGLSSIGKSLLKGVFQEGEDIMSQLWSDEYTQYWNGLTTDWLRFLDTNGFDLSPKIINLDWNGYQKYKLNDEEMGKIMSLSWDNPQKMMKSRELKTFGRKYYQDFLNKKTKKQWMDMRSKWFDKIFGGFFKNKESVINQNIKSFFEAQMSIGEIGMWYGSDGGEKIIYIPSKTEFELSTGMMRYEYTSSPSTTGYLIKIDMYNDKTLIISIDVNVRFISGQMNNSPSTKSKMKMKMKPSDWNLIFGK